MTVIDHDRTRFRRACSKFPTGVTVTTVLGTDRSPHGITVSSFTSVSLDPPLILVCIDHRSQMLNHLKVNDHFGINILSAQQRELSLKFSKNWSDRFKDVAWYPGETGVPLLSDVSANLESQAVDIHSAGDHAVIIGRVLHVHIGEHVPLAYVDSGFTTVLRS